MLRKNMTALVVIAFVGQLVFGSTALGITFVDAQQQVRGKIGWMSISDGEEHVLTDQYVPPTPQDLGDADLDVSLSQIGVSPSASLLSTFAAGQFTASGSASASAVWGSHPEDAYDVHGTGSSRFSVTFITGSSPEYLHLGGQIQVAMGGLDWYPEHVYSFVKLFRMDDAKLVLIWEAALDGTDAPSTTPIDHALWLDSDQIYTIQARADASTLAVEVGGATRSGAFSLTATCSCVVPDVVGMTEADAQSALESAGLVKGAVTYDQSATVPAGHVMAQNPGAGDSVDCGSAVDLVISYGEAVLPLPDLVGEFGAVSFKAPLGPGDKIRTRIVVSNRGLGTVARKQLIDIDIRLRPCGVIGDAEDIPLMLLSDQSISGLRAGASKKFGIRTRLPTDLEGGEYRLAAVVDSSNDVEEWIESNNTALSECLEVVE